MRVGIALPQYRIDVDAGAPVWRSTMQIARLAESLGLDSVWLSDHPFAVGPDGVASGALDPFVAAAALARVTAKTRIGTLVASASMRAPGLVAHQFRTLGAAGPGRMVAGLGAGWYPDEHRAFGAALRPFAERAADLERAVELIGSDDRHPEVLVGGTGARILDVAARGAGAWNVAWDPSPEAFAALNASLDERCALAGRDPSTLRRTLGLTVAVGATDADVDAAIERLRTRATFLATVDRATLERSIVVGTPWRCADAIASYARCDEVIVALLLRDDEAMLELFAREVMPAVPTLR